MEKEKKTLIEKFKECSKKVKIAIVVALLCVVAAIISIVVFAPTGEKTFSVKTALKEVLESSEMLTSEYTYNSIAQVPIDDSKPMDKDNIKYHIAYKGIVKSGFDFEKIDVVEKDGSITVIIPEIKVKSVEVDTDLEYIFTKQKYDTEKTYVEAYNACCKDLEDKAETNDTLQNTAIESAVETITALTKPFEKQLEDGKTIKIVYIDDYDAEEK